MHPEGHSMHMVWGRLPCVVAATVLTGVGAGALVEKGLLSRH